MPYVSKATFALINAIVRTIIWTFFGPFAAVAVAGEEGRSETTSVLYLSGVQDERAPRRAIDNWSLYQLRHRHGIAVG